MDATLQRIVLQMENQKIKQRPTIPQERYTYPIVCAICCEIEPQRRFPTIYWKQTLPYIGKP